MNRLGPTVLRYGGVSALALAFDFGVTGGLIRWAGLGPVAASAVGFSAGAWLAYLLASRWAFRGHGHRTNWRGFLLFSAIGLGGLVINSGLMWAGTAALGLAWPTAKLLAAGGSFVFNFVARRATLYAAPPEVPA